VLLQEPVDEHESKDKAEQLLDDAVVRRARVVEIVNSPDVAHTEA
jgi:hypothetical protein